MSRGHQADGREWHRAREDEAAHISALIDDMAGCVPDRRHHLPLIDQSRPGAIKDPPRHAMCQFSGDLFHYFQLLYL